MKRPWMPLYIADYHKDTQRLTTLQHGAYLLLIMDYWTTGPLPDDDQQLASVCKLDAKEWKKNRPILERFFQTEDGQWRHKRIDDEITHCADVSEKRRMARLARGDQGANNGTANVSAIAPSNARRNVGH